MLTQLLLVEALTTLHSIILSGLRVVIRIFRVKINIFTKNTLHNTNKKWEKLGTNTVR